MHTSSNLVTCLKCNKELDQEDRPEPRPGEIEVVFGGVVCFTQGNYGSKVFDPFQEKTEIKFYICDECLVASEQVVIFSGNEDESPFNLPSPGEDA